MATFFILTNEQGDLLEQVLSFARQFKSDAKQPQQLYAERDHAVQVIADLYDKALDIEMEALDEAGYFDNPPKLEGEE